MAGSARQSVPAPDDPRPWERPGAVRRDCEPHRSEVLGFLAGPAVTCGSLALLFWGVSGLLGLPLGVAAWVMAGRDLARMRAGLMDPAGERDAEMARTCGAVGAMLSAFSLAAWGLFFGLLRLMG